MKVLVCGPRDWLAQAPIEAELGTLPKGTVIVHGGATGVDNIAGFVAQSLGFEVRPYPVNLELDGPWPAAGHHRNARMLEAEKEGLDQAIAFKYQEDLTKGTKNMVGQLAKAGIPCKIVLARRR